MLDATAFVKTSAADEFTFFGFGKEHVLCECVSFDFLGCLERGGIRIGCAGLRQILLCLIAELQTGDAQGMIKHVCYRVEQRFKEFGIVHLCCRELDNGAVTSPVESACWSGRGEERFDFEEFYSAVVERFTCRVA